jgi:hypothetical protein
MYAFLMRELVALAVFVVPRAVVVAVSAVGHQRVEMPSNTTSGASNTRIIFSSPALYRRYDVSEISVVTVAVSFVPAVAAVTDNFKGPFDETPTSVPFAPPVSEVCNAEFAFGANARHVKLYPCICGLLISAQFPT